MSTTAPRTSPCRGCGKPIIWAKTESLKNMPLDATAPVYRLVETASGKQVVLAADCYVSHFKTCPKADQF